MVNAYSSLILPVHLFMFLYPHVDKENILHPKRAKIIYEESVILSTATEENHARIMPYRCL